MRGEYSLSDIAAATGNNSNDGMFGGNFAWWIVVLLLFGWGRNGLGGNGCGNGCGANITCATPADVYNAVDQQTLISKLDQQTYGLADTFNSLNNTLNNNFRGIDNAICTLGYQGAQHANMLSSQLASCCCGIERQISDCCCKVERSIDGVNYNNAMQTNMLQQTMCNNTRDILESNNNNTRAILDFLTKDKIDTLQAENQALKFQASQTAQNSFIAANQEAQTAELIRRLGADCPVPSYIVQPPTPVSFPTNCCGQFSGFNTCGNY